MEALLNPVGEFIKEENCWPSRWGELVGEIEQAPRHLRRSVAGLSELQLDTKFRNWTILQLLLHLADSHVNSYLRYRWAFTEEPPRSKHTSRTVGARILAHGTRLSNRVLRYLKRSFCVRFSPLISYGRSCIPIPGKQIGWIRYGAIAFAVPIAARDRLPDTANNTTVSHN